MIAKVIAHGPTREAAARRLAGALAGTTIAGIATNRDLLVRTLRHPEFLGDRGDSEFLERNDPAVLGRALVEGDERDVYAAAAALALQAVNRTGDAHTAGVASGFRNVVTSPQRVTLSAGDEHLEVGYLFQRGVLRSLAVDDRELRDPVVHELCTDRVDLAVDGVRRSFVVATAGPLVAVTTTRGSVVLERVARFVEPDEQVAPGSTVATMPGTIVAVRVAEGDVVSAGDTLVVMEAMKMELAVTASHAGVVTAVPVSPGAAVEAGAVLVVVEEAAAAGDGAAAG
jgi:propionyl-CoA carboxylase alpha chain